MAIVWFLPITLIVIIIVELFINLRQEIRTRNELITIILLSIASAVLLASLSLLAFKNFGSPNSFGLLALFVVIVPIQLALIIPVTLVDYFIYYLIYRGNQSVNIIYRIIIPLAFNVIGGSIVLIITAGFMAMPALDSFIHRDVIVTIKSERFFLSDPYNPHTSTYQVVLNVKNPSQKDISGVTFWLVTGKSKDDKSFADFMDDFLGSNEDRNVFPAGESEVVIDVSIYANKNYSQCTDGSLEKPLYLLYSIGNTSKSIVVSNRINQQILETACTQ